MAIRSLLLACVALGTVVRAQQLDLSLPAAFPAERYTPHGYIDNPYHSMVFHRSGVLRSLPPLGFGWWRVDFPGSYGGGARDHINYLSALLLHVTVDDSLFVTADDFSRRQVDLFSRYHSKQVMSYDWRYEKVTVSARYFLPREHTLACLVLVENESDAERTVRIGATQMYKLGDVKWWGRDGLTGRFVKERNAGVSKTWAYGDVFAAGASLVPVRQAVCSSRGEWLQWCGGGKGSSWAFVRGQLPLYLAQEYRVSIPPHGRTQMLVCLSRGVNEAAALEELRQGQEEALPALKRQLDDDQSFWSAAPVLEGDWPAPWKRGWVYDFETLRMNVRRPLGIFKHPWDGMQVHSPRAVLGETSLDMMTLSYADPLLAREVLYGTFADALQPNVPCAREDGSVNMISSDGAECGTAPMWGFPFHVIRSLYLASLDTAWIRALYPHLKEYVEWWLEHRTDSEGWLHCNNSWESGQDGSRRFLVAQANEAAVADFVRTVDVEASMAEAMHVMEEFAPVAGRPEEQEHWRNLRRQREEHTRAMFFDGWYRDIDGRTGKPIILPDYYDVMMLTPLACSVATDEQVAALRPQVRSFPGKTGRWLQWPPGLFTFAEAAWRAGERMAAAEAVAMTADRVYVQTDARDVRFVDSSGFFYRIPGVANEFWPLRNIPPGGENYGWGATLPMNIIRNIIGFREQEGRSEDTFAFAPSVPDALLPIGKTIAIRRLKYRGVDLDLSLKREAGDLLHATITYRSHEPCKLEVTGIGLHRTTAERSGRTGGDVSFQIENGGMSSVTIRR